MAVDPREEHAEAKKQLDQTLTSVGTVYQELNELSAAFNLTGNYGMRDKCAKLSETLKNNARTMAHVLVLIERADLAVQTERQTYGIVAKT